MILHRMLCLNTTFFRTSSPCNYPISSPFPSFRHRHSHSHLVPHHRPLQRRPTNWPYPACRLALPPLPASPSSYPSRSSHSPLPPSSPGYNKAIAPPSSTPAAPLVAATAVPSPTPAAAALRPRASAAQATRPSSGSAAGASPPGYTGGACS
ncbi:hypothetical protein VTI74DRAFT_4976 [Chaetomium olivicolor]